MGKIDLHLHTTGSDGEETVDVVIKKAYEDGQKAIAITDHNHFSTLKPYEYQGMQVIPGCEFSCDYITKESGEHIEIHVVGLFLNGVDEEPFKKQFTAYKNSQERYIKAVLTLLGENGMPIGMEEIKQQMKEEHTSYMGRSQVAKMMAKKGYVKNIDEAKANWTGNTAPNFINTAPYFNLDTIENTVMLILENGGFPILAHPFTYPMSKAEVEHLIMHYRSITKEPIGIEVYYEKYLKEPEKVAYLEKMAKEHHFLRSASSDRHRTTQVFATRGQVEMLDKILEAMKNKER